MRRSLAIWLALVLGTPLVGGCGTVEQEPRVCSSLACVCPGSGFQYAGQCVEGELVCDCPDAAPRALECGFASCSKNSGDASGSWRLVGACPRRPSEKTACGSIVELRNLTLSGSVQPDYLQANARASALLISEHSPECGTSCAAIAASLGADAHCEAGSNGIACRCAQSYALQTWTVSSPASETYSVLADPPSSSTNAYYCQNGESLTISTDAFDLAFERGGCTPGEASCDGMQPVRCGPEHEFVTAPACEDAFTCFKGACVPKCEPHALYCDRGYEYRCGESGVKGEGSTRQACGENVSCVNGPGCQGARQVDLGFNLGAGSLTNVVFVGEVLQVTQDATLISYSVRASLRDEGRLDWHVYEAPAETGPFQAIFEEASLLGASARDHLSPALSVPVVNGRYYLLAVSVAPTADIQLGGAGEGGAYAVPLGITSSQVQPADGFSVNALSTEPGMLIGRALFVP